MADGWSELGAALGGGGQSRQRAYQSGVDAGARQSLLLEQARQRRDENLGIQSVTPELITRAQVGDQEAQASLMSALVHGNRNPNQLATAQGTMQGTDFRRDAMAAAVDPGTSLDSLNRRMIVIGGKPVDLTKVQGHNVINPMVSPDAQTVSPTEIGLASIMAKGAQAKASDALTVKRAQAPSLSAGRSRRPTKAILPKAFELAAILGKQTDPATGREAIDPAAAQQVYGYIQSHPGASIADYVAKAPVGSPGALPPVGATTLTDLMGGSAKVLPSQPGAPSAVAAAPPAAARKVTRTGVANGRKVVQYDDGTVDYAD